MVDAHGAEALKKGDYPRRPRRLHVVQEQLVAEPLEVPVENGNSKVDPASVRPRLAEAAAASLDAIQRALLDAALGATASIG
jgi:hypothetical protein